MMQLTETTKKYLATAAGLSFLLGYGFLFAGIGRTYSLSNIGWSEKASAFFIAIGWLLLAIEDRSQMKSVSYWGYMLGFSAGIFWGGFSFASLLIGFLWLAIAFYKLSVSFKGYLANAVKSFRQLRDEVKKEESESGKTDSLSF